MKNATMYCLCLHDKFLAKMQTLGYVPVGLGNEKFSNEWLRDNTLDNISFKNKFYGEYTFHYWFWKNVLPKIEDNHWIGFCAYREYWGNKKEISENMKLEDLVIKEIPNEWENFETIISLYLGSGISSRFCALRLLDIIFPYLGLFEPYFERR